MTTLPQTTTVRFPRPGGTALAPAQLSGIQALGTPSLGGQLTGGDVLRVLRANAWLIIGTVFVAAVIGYLVNSWLAAHHPHYTAVGYERCSTPSELPRPGSIVPSGESSPQSIEIEQHDQAARIKQPGLVTRVLNNGDSPVRQTAWFKQFQTVANGKPSVNVAAAKDDLLDRLDVTPLANSRMLAVSMTTADPRDSATIVTEVINQHIKEMRDLMTGTEIDKATMLDSLRTQYEGELREKRTRINRIIDDLGKGGASVGYGGGSKEYELGALTSEQIRAQGQVFEMQSRLDRFNNSLVGGATPPEVESAIEHDPTYAEYRRISDEAELQLEQINYKVGDNNPLVVQVKRRMETYRQKAALVHDERKVSIIAGFRASLSAQLETAKLSLDALAQRQDVLRSQIAELAARRSEYERLLLEEKAISEKLARVRNDQESMASVYSAGKVATVEWATLPEVPTRPTFPKLSVTLSLAIGLGLSLSLGLAFLREMTDTTVRSPRDIARVGHLSLLGMIAHEADDPQTAGARLPLAIFEAPHSMIAEQFRQVRTRLQHGASLDTTRSILVTGCSPGDGKSTVACNLAAGLALNGRRILLVDANFRRPELHNIFNLPNSMGFADVLSAPEIFNDTVRPTEVANLSVLVSGGKPSNSTEMLESQLLVDFIERALEEYDHVIFDSGPLLIVSDSVALAPRVDGVISVVRAQGNSRGLLQRMRDQIRLLKAEHLGVILNAVRAQGGGYYGPQIKTYYAYHSPPASASIT